MKPAGLPQSPVGKQTRAQASLACTQGLPTVTSEAGADLAPLREEPSGGKATPSTARAGHSVVEVIWTGTWVLFQIPAAPLPPLVTLNKLLTSPASEFSSTKWGIGLTPQVGVVRPAKGACTGAP